MYPLFDEKGHSLIVERVHIQNEVVHAIITSLNYSTIPYDMAIDLFPFNSEMQYFIRNQEHYEYLLVLGLS